MKKLDLTTIHHGIVCFTFDDRNFEGWQNALPLFKKYNAHASFFLSGEMDEAALSTMAALQEAGHTVGLHSLHHADAPEYFEAHGGQAYYEHEVHPQLSVCREAGIEVHSFAYPNNKRNDATDSALGQFFSHFRAGVRGAAEEEVYVPVHQLAGSTVMHGFGIGAYYQTNQEELTEQLHRAADTNTCLTFFSHNIAPGAQGIHMPTELLEHCLRECQRCGIAVAGFDQL